MAKEVLDLILKAEEESARQLEDTRRSVLEMRQSAKRDAERQARNLQEEWAKEGAVRREQAKERAEQEKQRFEKETQALCRELSAKLEQKKRYAAQQVIRKITM